MDDEAFRDLMAGMSAAVAHQVRNPLSSVNGHVHLLLQSTSDEVIRNRAQYILHEVLRLEQAVADLVNLWSLKRWQPQWADPARVVSEWSRSTVCGPIRIDPASAPARWKLDPDRVIRALECLARTMRARCGQEGSVDLSFRTEEESLIILLDECEADSERLMTTSSGIWSEVDTVHRASFLMAEYVARQHGGLLSMVEGPGGGSGFQLTFGRI